MKKHRLLKLFQLLNHKFLRSIAVSTVWYACELGLIRERHQLLQCLHEECFKAGCHNFAANLRYTYQ